MPELAPNNQIHIPQPSVVGRPATLTAQEQAALTSGPRKIVAPTGSIKTLPAIAGAAPTAMPRSAASGGGAGATWHSNVQITSLWSINQDRNSWIYVSGSWAQLSNTSESGFMALTILASVAKQLQLPVNCRQDSDGMIHEIYI